MRKLKYLAILLILMFPVSVLGQEYSQTVKGKVLDEDTQFPLPGAIVFLSNSSPVVASMVDFDGNFRFDNIPVGRHDFKIYYRGYEDILLNEVLVGSGREVMLTIKMKETISDEKESQFIGTDDKIEAINPMATVSTTQITIESTSRIAGGINDPARTAQSYAGIAVYEDDNNELVIRGNSPWGVSWRMEGIEIPNPNHFPNKESNNGGGVCALSTMVLANSDFLSSAFPAEYGNALSGVFDLQLRRGNADKQEYAFQIGVLGLQAALEGPLSKNSEASYLFNYRYSSLSLLDKVGINFTGDDVAPQWQDLSLKIFIPTKNAGEFSIWGLGGQSSAGDLAVRDTTLWNFISNKRQYNEDHLVGVFGLSHKYLFANSKTYINTVAAYSTTNDKIHTDTLDYDFLPGTINDEKFHFQNFSLNSFVNHKFNTRNTIRAGGVIHYKLYDFAIIEFDWLNSRSLERMANKNGATTMLEAYFQWKFRLNEKIDINSGVHYTQLMLNNDFSVEPRIGIKWKVNPKHTISFGAGLHSKTDAIWKFFTEQTNENNEIIYPNKDLKMKKAAHIVLGHNWSFTPNLRLKTELYYQYLYDVPVVGDDTTGTLSSLNLGSSFTYGKYSNASTGRNYGVEFTLEKFFSKNWYMLATGTLFASKYTMLNFPERNTEFNSNFISNYMVGREFKVGKNKQNIISANARLIWKGGYRDTPLDVEETFAQKRSILDYDRAYEYQAPDYLRLDVGLSYRHNRHNRSWILSLDIQNATSHYNIGGEQYNSADNQIYLWYMSGILPIINYRIEF